MNSILERIHQVIANLICTFALQNNHLDKDDPCSGILAATDFAARSMYYTTLKSMPGHLIFRRGIILNNPFVVDWEDIRLGKQIIIYNNNQLEN